MTRFLQALTAALALALSGAAGGAVGLGYAADSALNKRFGTQ